MVSPLAVGVGMMGTRFSGVLAAGLALAALSQTAAQVFRRGGVEFHAARTVTVAAPLPAVVVAEFLHHGEIAPDGRNVGVTCKGQDLLPCRVLQLGPGDFCRVAFQTFGGQTEYDILYGGDAPANPPKWTSQEGLLLEIREFKNCDLQRFESVRDAFNSAKPIGADYVENVHHGENPLSLKPGPFLSRYSGVLRIGITGKYGFMTSSQDASFLVIDDKKVVESPGRHGPAHVARPGSRKDIELTKGDHKFEYYHAAAGNAAMMMAAWESNPQEERPKPALIPSEAFRVRSVVHAPAGPVQFHTGKLLPDFNVLIEGDVPLPDNDQPLIGVNFKDLSAKALSMGAKTQWDFGDGQTSDKPTADHVYLRPGLYTVKLSFKRPVAKPVEIFNRVYIDRPKLTRKDKQKAPTLDDYLPILDAYEPGRLEAGALRQLVAAYVAKAEDLTAKAEEQRAEEKAKAEDPDRRPEEPKRGAKARKRPAPARDSQEIEAERYLAKAVAVGKTPFLGDGPVKGDDELFKLAQTVALLARDTLGDSELALAIYKGAAAKINIADWKASCEIEAADVALGDLADAKAAKAFLDAAMTHLANRSGGAVAATLQRVLGDYHAATGDGKAARKAYLEAQRILGNGRKFAEQAAWRGARSLSTEDYIKSGQFDRAVAELRAWQRDFPAEKIDGYLTLLLAQYQASRERYAAAIAQAEQLQAVNRDSPYVDQILLLAADCELKRGKPDRAAATLHALVKDYPGSPLVAEAKELLEKVEGRKPQDTKRRPPSKPAEL